MSAVRRPRRGPVALVCAALLLAVLLAAALSASAATSSWSSQGPVDGLPEGVVSLAIDPGSPQTLYAATFEGRIFKTVNGGTAWSPADTGLAIPFVSEVRVDPAVSGTVYAAGFEGGVFKSTDAGATWTRASGGLGASLSVIASRSPGRRARCSRPRRPACSARRTAAGPGPKFGAGLAPGFMDLLTVHPAAPGNLYATLAGSPFVSGDDGATWTPLAAPRRSSSWRSRRSLQRPDPLRGDDGRGGEDHRRRRDLDSGEHGLRRRRPGDVARDRSRRRP